MKGEVVLLFEFLASKPRALVLAQWFSMELILAKLLCINSLIVKTMFTRTRPNKQGTQPAGHGFDMLAIQSVV